MITITLILLFLFFIPLIFYVITLQKTFEIISVENRKMPPQRVWLLLIPLVGIIFHFIVVRDLADSIKDEAISKDVPVRESSPAYSIGLAMCILSCLFFIPGLKDFTNLAAIVCWIIYWVKISYYKKMLSQISN